MSLKIKADILVTKHLNDRMKNKQKITYLIFKEVIKIKNETLKDKNWNKLLKHPVH